MTPKTIEGAVELERKKIDILCGLIASPHQRIVHQLPDEYCPKGSFFPRSSHTTVPFNGLRRAVSNLIKDGYLSVDKAKSDESQIEYRYSASGKRHILDSHHERLFAHRQVSKQARHRLKKARALLPKKDALRGSASAPAISPY